VSNGGNLDVTTPVHEAIAVIRNAEVIVVLKLKHLETVVDRFNVQPLYSVSACLISLHVEQNCTTFFFEVDSG
jgi:hypothetical protein